MTKILIYSKQQKRIFFIHQAMHATSNIGRIKDNKRKQKKQMCINVPVITLNKVPIVKMPVLMG